MPFTSLVSSLSKHENRQMTSFCHVAQAAPWQHALCAIILFSCLYSTLLYCPLPHGLWCPCPSVVLLVQPLSPAHAPMWVAFSPSLWDWTVSADMVAYHVAFSQMSLNKYPISLKWLIVAVRYQTRTGLFLGVSLYSSACCLCCGVY